MLKIEIAGFCNTLWDSRGIVRTLGLSYLGLVGQAEKPRLVHGVPNLYRWSTDGVFILTPECRVSMTSLWMGV